MSRSKIAPCLIAAALASQVLVDNGAAQAEPDTRNLEIYATTDVHGHLVPHKTRLPGGHGDRVGEVGGLALIGGLLKNARARFPGRVVLLDGGDLMQGTLASNLGEGAAIIRGLNPLGYTAAALGNHDFDYGPVGPSAVPGGPGDDPRGALKARIAEAKFPILSANVVGDDGARPFPAYVVRVVDGVPIGIIGATTIGLPTTTMRPNIVGLKVEPLLPSVLAAAEQARKQGARVLVLVMHAGGECRRGPRAFTDADSDDLSGCHVQEEGFELARALAAKTREGGPRWSAIIGGHTHQPLTAVIDGIPFVQAGKNGEHLGHVSIEVRGSGAEAAPTGHFAIERGIDVCARLNKAGHCAADGDADTRPMTYLGPVVPDAAVAAAIAADLEKARVEASRPVGVELPEGLPAGYHDESALGNFAADALRRAAKADVGLINGGGLRADLPAGPLTYGGLYEAFPFDNQLVSVELSGADLRRTIVHNLHSRFGALSYSGLSVRARCDAGKVLVDVTLADGRALDPKARYHVGAPDFLAMGGDDAVHQPRKIGPPIALVRSALEQALHEHGGVLHARDPAVFDPAHPRVAIPGPRPIGCGTIEAHEEPPSQAPSQAKN
jgi:5'-nucleotidase